MGIVTRQVILWKTPYNYGNDAVFTRHRLGSRSKCVVTMRWFGCVHRELGSGKRIHVAASTPTYAMVD